ncbi:Serine/threonine protein phosphatase 2A 55 kDa regulatory subunit B alpha isoform [Camellia lanceoleosa]|uniref:Serine/threonine protein phosphatase 2A 55 kDa regulatory subunit B alpha isoform n=1 Tax=Camellia lanceoleosa TaxID=1840588 RepID=A0ACC0H3U8_9ERIC|nr:Serine/threonine protein phosphatase 2A 55 kDa regulatory subunit B alpha isoform [Camellia lanceoleosa]
MLLLMAFYMYDVMTRKTYGQLRYFGGGLSIGWSKGSASKGSDGSLDDCVYHLICPCCTLCQVTSHETSLMARCRRVYAHAHDYHINSISNNRSKILKIVRASMELFRGGSLPLLRNTPS